MDHVPLTTRLELMAGLETSDNLTFYYIILEYYKIIARAVFHVGLLTWYVSSDSYFAQPCLKTKIIQGYFVCSVNHIIKHV